MTKFRLVLLGLVILSVCLLPNLAAADIITANLGNTASGLTSGTVYNPPTAVTAAQSGQLAPFDATCGADGGPSGSTNCSASWTFSYSSLAGYTINSATISFGIYDIDSGATGNQVANFSLTSGDDLTSSLNALAEGLNTNAGAKNNEYDVFTLSLTNASFATLLGGSAQFNLALQAPGIGILATAPSNGGRLIYSTLTIDASPNTPPPPTVPEPSSMILLLSGLSTVGYKLRGHLQK